MFLVTAVILCILSIYLSIDYIGPRIIRIRHDRVFGFNALRASDLIVQEYDKSGNLWASRGQLVYRLTKGDNRFIRMSRIPTGLSPYWLNNFRFFRLMTGKSECIEMVLSGESGICALSAGKIWYSPSSHERYSGTFSLSHYGPGIGRGIMHYGILGADNNRIWFGEYFYNANREAVRVFESRDQGMSWNTAREFPAGEIRHIHAIQRDPWTGKIWICTGDQDPESMIGYTQDNFKTLIIIGKGSQIWRSCHLVFTPEYVYWGTDTGSEMVSGVYRWDRSSGEVFKVCPVEGAVFYGTRLLSGTVVMTTDREGFPNERDDKTKLILISADGHTISVDCGAWKQKKPSARNGYAMMRIPRNQDGALLALTILNQKGLPEAELVLIDEEEFLTSLSGK